MLRRRSAVRIDILRHGLTPEEALVVESAAIDLLGLDDLANRVRGQHSRDLGRTSVDAINAPRAVPTPPISA